MYITISGEKIELGQLSYIEYYFLKGNNATYQKGVLYACHKNKVAPLYSDEDKLIQIPEFAGLNKNELDIIDVENKINSKNYYIQSNEYIEKWNNEINKTND